MSIRGLIRNFFSSKPEAAEAAAAYPRLPQVDGLAQIEARSATAHVFESAEIAGAVAADLSDQEAPRDLAP
jgi:hypothetical protein